MNTLKLEILASDILSTDYTNGNDCAITRALAKIGRPDLIDHGVKIVFKDGKVFINCNNPTYQELSSRVALMYLGLKDVEDFTHTLIY